MEEEETLPVTPPVDAPVVPRDEKGRWLKKHPGGHAPFTSDTARDAIVKRWDRVRNEFARGIAEGTPSGREGTSAAWRAIGRHAAEVYFSSDRPSEIARLGHFIASMFRPERREMSEDEQTGSGEAETLAKFAVAAAAEIRRRKETGNW